jgi:hypothetical protein|tara:strand:- start:389 stop:904 length:516 start_codon:yes stop_codon:yes gene_type:complete
MACNITSGFTLDCNDSNGGIEKIFIANGPVESITETAGTISAITVAGSALTPSDFFEFEVPRQTSSFTETINVSNENGTVFYDQALTMILNKMDAAKRDQILLLSQNNEMVVVFKDNNLKYFSVGIQRGAYMTAGTSVSGVAYGDRNGYELTFSGMEEQPAFEVTSTIVEA